LISFLAQVEGLSIRNILDKYISKDFIELLPKTLMNYLDDIDIIPDIDAEIPEFKLLKEFVPILPLTRYTSEALKYLISRGANKLSIIKSLELMYCKEAYQPVKESKPHLIKDRIIFPIRYMDKIVGYQGRDIIGNVKMKYYISPGLQKTKLIYNLQNVKNADTITIVEGVFDLIKCWNHNPICLFGKTISIEQLSLLQQLPNLKTIILAIDPDTKVLTKEQKKNKKDSNYDTLAKILQNFWEVREADIPEGKDAGDHSIEEMDKILSRSTPYNKNSLTFLLDI
jgi:hypothetical protein